MAEAIDMPNSNLYCVVCQERPVFKCSRCKCVYYCSRAHQQKHWSLHKPFCHHSNMPPDHDTVAPDDCFADAQQFTKEDLRGFVAYSLKKVGVCVIDNFWNAAFTSSLVNECSVMQVRYDVEGPTEVDDTDFKTFVFTRQIFQRFDELIALSVPQSRRHHLAHVISNEPICHDNSGDSRYLYCTYFTRANASTTRFYVGRKVIVVQTRCNRAVFSWSSVRMEVINNQRFCNDVIAVSAKYTVPFV